MATSNKEYPFTEIEQRWQQFWDKEGTFTAPNQSEKPKYYLLDMFPYPSGAGLHAGHVENFAGSDILGRYKLARGFNVLHPMGWDAFGLPAEQYAVKTGTHPAKTTLTNIDNFRRQIKALGLAIDWTREVNTTDPHYFRWTQWIFLKLFQNKLAYVDERPVNWCPELGTVLANEEVVDGKSEVGGHPVERRNLRQWVLRITAYADRLLEGLDKLEWPDSTKAMQRNWIGRSTGANVTFSLESGDDSITVYTTRPDTLFGATYMVLAPEHPLVGKLVTGENLKAAQKYIQEAAGKSDLLRTELAKEKSGVFTGSYAINPVNGERIPIWIADYVLMSYGTGAIMAVPAHDERDHEFATKFNLPIIDVISPPEGEEPEEGEAFTGVGTMINSGEFNGLDSVTGKERIIAQLQAAGKGEAAVNYKLRDWLFSRQRYWGEPFPIVWVDDETWNSIKDLKTAVTALVPGEPVTYHQDGTLYHALPLPESALPLELPKTDNYEPAGDGESPLANNHDWVNIWFNLETGEGVPQSGEKPSSGTWIPARRETNTMPQWAGSCWYYLRYLDPANAEAILDPAIRDYWGVPDFYMGGAEHAVLHLLYARFWHLFLKDMGVVTDDEPFKKLFHQGIILGEDGEKMSKSRGNVVNPDDFIASHGADSLRAYLMFMGPLEDMKPWNSQGIEGVHRFLRRVCRDLVGSGDGLPPKIASDKPESTEMTRVLHETIRKVTADYDNIRFNTALSQLMIFMNQLNKEESLNVESAKDFARLLAPLAPHLAEELWHKLGGEGSVAFAGWPTWNEDLLKTDEVQIGLLVNGKPRGEAKVSKTAKQDEVLALAQADEKVSAHLSGKEIIKVIYVPGKILNVVVRG
ncbi:leucine--tRNA ligase [Puniceicoccales bacterium CK1056]|uniref:Leucine--tRNA ligase n=1 Tax=Oceanipulchritudo coccoides TaxID=2706888 RepID=A0A6B2M5X1_9BACT|nr:leucine--tRNA ligase [Oceanipulchritudo coccoides]NDV63559.1 leucine--tRNA ligase [Oceanipulchritudo coccoides]